MSFINHALRLCLVLFFFNIFLQPIAAQQDAELEQAKTTFNILSQEGGLIVRLPTNSTSIAGMNKMLENGDLSVKNRAILEERVATKMAETHRNNTWLMQLLNDHYDIGEIYFIYDTAFTQLKEGEQSGYFLNENLEIDPNIFLPSKDYLLLRIGVPDASLYAVQEALILSDKNNENIPAPFPSVSGLSASRIFSFLISAERMEYLRLEDAVVKLCKRLTVFESKNMP